MSGQIPLDSRDAAKKAPLRNVDLPLENIVPYQYLVYLEPGYSLEDHKRTVGADGLPEGSIKHVIDLHLDPNPVCCVAHLSESSLDTIRSDPGVDLVECDVRGNLDD